MSAAAEPRSVSEIMGGHERGGITLKIDFKAVSAAREAA